MSKDFSEKIRKLREDKGLSQSDLAKRSELKASAISHFETGRRSPSMGNLRRIADALGVSTDYLLGRAGEPIPVGPDISKLVADYSRLSSYDQKNVLRFAAMLVEQKSDENVEKK